MESGIRGLPKQPVTYTDYDLGAYPAAAGFQTVLHKLSKLPSNVILFLEAVTNDNAWLPGMRLELITGAEQSGSQQSAITLGVNATTITVTNSLSVLGMVNRNTGANFAITPANWKLFLRVFP